MGTFTSGGFSNLTAAAPLNEEDEHDLVLSLIRDLNDLYATGLCLEPVVDRFMEDEVFGPGPEQKNQLLLIGSSHLRRAAVHLDSSKWEIIDLCTGGFRINDKNVSEAIEKVDTLKSDGLLRDYVAIIQLFDNSVYQVGGPGGNRHLPVSDSRGRFHIDGPLLYFWPTSRASGT
jgi:hypothetical protein